MNATPQLIRFQDIQAMNRADSFKVLAPVIRPDDVALRGRFCTMGLRSGLRLHATDSVDVHNMVTQVASQPGTTLGLFLEGGARVSLGGRAIALGQGVTLPHAFALTSTEPDLFERRGLCGQRVRKVNVNIPQGWLEAEDWPEAKRLAALIGDHLSLRTWTPSRRQAELAIRLLNPSPDMPFLEGLYRETLALEFVGEVLREWAGDMRPGRVGARDLARLRRACDYIDANHESRLHVDQVAQAAGMSVSALQRLFHAAHGTSVLEFARVRRLEQARQALESGHHSVTEVALNAGYGSSANFATAFKRQFGLSPSQVRKRG